MAIEAQETELLDRVAADASQLETELHACARCTLFAVARNLDLAEDACLETALKTAIPLSGGIAGTRNQCGALVGGVMAIGLGMVKYDARTANPGQRKPVTAAAKKFYRWFEQEIGHARCYDIRETGLGRFYDTGDPDEARKFEEAGGYELCAGVVGKAARKAAEIILESRRAQ